MMRNKLPQALPCLQITGLAAQVAEKYGLRPVPYSALRRVYDTHFPLPVQTLSPNGQMWVDRYYMCDNGSVKEYGEALPERSGEGFSIPGGNHAEKTPPSLRLSGLPGTDRTAILPGAREGRVVAV